MTNPLYLLGAGLGVISVYMSAVWALSTLIKNSGIVDIAWSMGFSLAAALYLLLGHNLNQRTIVITAMVVVWSLRLTWHLALRFKHLYPKEDPRYTKLKEQLGEHESAKMLLIFLWQGAILTFLTAPLAVAIADSQSGVAFLQCLALVIWAVSLIGETVADWQLSQFSRNDGNHGKTCQTGLWHYSRHPNYFFEWLGSAAFVVYVLDSPAGVWTLACPALLLYLLFNVTGVKPSEEHSLKTRPDYAEYAKSTSPFVPWFRKAS